ncbi:MAG: hypothetical protein WCR40_01905 [Candidatus Paceibacterota bacterium]
MDKWLLISIFLIAFASFLVIFIRIVGREETEKNNLSADDFEIIE